MSFNDRLGMTAGADAGTVELEARNEHLVAPGTVHFAVLATLGEVSAAAAVGSAVVPVAVSTQLMSRARPGLLTARGKVLKAGRRMAFAEGEISQEGRIVAKVSVTFALI
jgi:acyl-coenzyme A thioesterase PaaI-like protein